MSARAPLAVVVLNYRTGAMTVDCLRSLAAEVEEGERVVVVDNASGDGSAEHIAAAIEGEGWGAWASLVEAEGNHGFSAGNNVGILAVDAEAYFLLNSDTLVRPGALAALREALAAHPEVGLFSPRLEWPDGEPQRSVFRDPTPWSELERAAGTGPVSRLLARRIVAPPVVDEPVAFEWASFAAILVRREVFLRIGLMDEGYFLYFEDIDFCRRARRAGVASLHWPAARIVHLRGGSGPVKENLARRRRQPAYYWQARSRFFAKAYGRLGLLLANLMWLCGRAVSLARELVRNKQPHLCEKEGRDIWHNLTRPVDPAECWRGSFPREDRPDAPQA